jgi:hypothetical protein
MNIAPEQLIYNRRDKITGVVLRTLPVCRHPHSIRDITVDERNKIQILMKEAFYETIV